MGEMKAENKSLFFEQYKIIVQSVEKNSDRRNIANKFYFSLNTLLITSVTLLIENEVLDLTNIVIQVIFLFGIFLNIIWYINITSYRKLNSAKFKVINEMEKVLPFPIYAEEWKFLIKDNYKKLTFIEQGVALIFTLILTILFMYSSILSKNIFFLVSVIVLSLIVVLIQYLMNRKK